jgi:hypothetical protein
MNLLFFFWLIFACAQGENGNVPSPRAVRISADIQSKKEKACVVCPVSERKNEEPCVICQEDLLEQQMKKTACNHRFHLHCILSWLNEKEDCPLCRTKLKIYENFEVVQDTCVQESVAVPQRSAALQLLQMARSALYCLGYWVVFISVFLDENLDIRVILLCVSWFMGVCPWSSSKIAHLTSCIFLFWAIGVSFQFK